MQRGLLIAFEGVDASGLTTHSKLLVNELNSIGFRSVYTKEPTNGPIGALIRNFLSENKLSLREASELLALLFAADRHWHLYMDPSLPGGGILGAIRKGFIVVSDRYKYSSIAYQGLYAGFDWVQSVNSRIIDADIIVFLDVDCRVIEERLSSRPTKEIYERINVLKEIKKSFYNLFNKLNNIKIISIKINYEAAREEPIKVFKKIILPRLLPALKEFGLPVYVDSKPASISQDLKDILG